MTTITTPVPNGTKLGTTLDGPGGNNNENVTPGYVGADGYWHAQPVDAAGNLSVAIATQLVPKVYDYISLGYTGSDLTSVVYKTGGSGGTTVATLTLTYTLGVLTSVART